MKKSTLLTLTAGLLLMLAISFDVKAQAGTDTLALQVTTLRDKIEGVTEKLSTAEADLFKLTKIKISGYLQAQFQHFEQSSVYPSNNFQIRRARFKLMYEPTNGVAFCLQPDFQPGNFVIKEAYARLNEPWLKTFSLWAGKFNRLNYEVEYSSSDLENLERSRLITSIYPGEYAIGAKLEVAPPKLPLKLQLAVFNGNDNMTVTDANGVNINPENKDFDDAKDLMARLTYGFRLGNFGGLTIGAHTYLGWMRSPVDTILKSDYTVDKTIQVGKNLTRNWAGVEAQLYLDLLGGLTLKGEYIFGNNAFPGAKSSTTVTSPTDFHFNASRDTLFTTSLATTTKNYRPNMVRSFSGYYVYLIKNIGKRHQISIRYDYYDPNTGIAGSEIGNTASNGKNTSGYSSKTTYSGRNPVVANTATTNTIQNYKYSSGTADIAYGTIGLCYNYYVTDNIKISVAYDIPMNEKVGKNADGTGYVSNSYTSVYGTPGTTIDYSKAIPMDVLTVRLQAKF